MPLRNGTGSGSPTITACFSCLQAKVGPARITASSRSPSGTIGSRKRRSLPAFWPRRRRFRRLTTAGLEDVEVYRAQKTVFGQPRTIVVTFNPNLLEGQLQGLTQHLDKARHKLHDLKIQLQRRRQGKVKGGKAPTRESVQKQIDGICSAQFVKRILHTEVRTVRSGLELTFRTDQAELDRLCRVQFGKTILFTDNADWSEASALGRSDPALLSKNDPD